MKVSIFIKFFAIIFSAFVLFELINVSIDEAILSNYHIELLDEKYDSSETEKITFTNEKELIENFDHYYKEDEFTYHVLMKDGPTDAILADFHEVENRPDFMAVVQNRNDEIMTYYYDVTEAPKEEIEKIKKFFELDYRDINNIDYIKDENGKLSKLICDGIEIDLTTFTELELSQFLDFYSGVEQLIFYHELYIDHFETDELIYEKMGVNTEGYAIQLVNHEEYRQKCLDMIELDVSNDPFRSSLHHYYEPYKDGYIVYNKIYIGSQNNEFADYYVYDFFYMDTLNVQHQVRNELIYNKMPVYVSLVVFSIVVSLVISSMLTKKIKTISDATTRIANNDFDVQLKDKSTDEIGVLSSNINLMSSRLKETIANLNNEIEQVKHLEGLRKEFIANFTHEIKTPLAIINGYIELLDQVEDESKKRAYLNSINKETEKINHLVMSMLDLSRLESGKVSLNKYEIDLEDMLTEIIDGYLPLIKKKEIKIQMDIDRSSVIADEEELKKVLTNFLSNAIRHTPDKGQIIIQFKENVFSIENEGEQLSDEDKSIVFETYVSSNREGTGLGLAICKAILELHQFKYGVENTKKGVKFYFEV